MKLRRSEPFRKHLIEEKNWLLVGEGEWNDTWVEVIGN